MAPLKADDGPSSRQAHASPPALPTAVVLHILGLLPTAAQAYSARQVCKAANDTLKACTSILASCKELPLWVLQQMHTAQRQQQEQHLACTATAYVGVKPHHRQQQQNLQLIASRAAAGDLQGVQWLVSQGCAADHASICSAAAKAGHLHILRFLRSLTPPCNWDSSTSTAAAAAGHTDVLQYMLVGADTVCECGPLEQQPGQVQ
jgi:hypothetical protein